MIMQTVCKWRLWSEQQNKAAGKPPEREGKMNGTSAVATIRDIDQMADAIVRSGLYGIKTKDQAIGLMLAAQAQGKHPGSIVHDYNIIQGRPAMRAERMLAHYQRAGGRVDWEEMTESRVAGRFSHPKGSPTPVLIEWTIAQAQKIGLSNKENWRQYPRAMLRARVISEGVRATWPDSSDGVYSAEEVADMPIVAEVPKPAVPLLAAPTPKVEHKVDPVPDAPTPPQESASATDRKIVCGIIEDVIVKHGKNSRGDWTKYGVKVNGEIYGTFSATDGELAVENKGAEVEIEWAEDGKYRKIVSMLPVIRPDKVDAEATPAGDNLPY
jgi:hypothetical protein